jgi:hypothetical protein
MHQPGRPPSSHLSAPFQSPLRRFGPEYRLALTQPIPNKVLNNSQDLTPDFEETMMVTWRLPSMASERRMTVDVTFHPDEGTS